MLIWLQGGEWYWEIISSHFCWPETEYEVNIFIFWYHGFPYSSREETVFQVFRFFHILILRTVILTVILALYLCKLGAFGSKNTNFLATLYFLSCQNISCCKPCSQTCVSIFLKKVSKKTTLYFENPYILNLLCFDLVIMLQIELDLPTLTK